MLNTTVQISAAPSMLQHLPSPSEHPTARTPLPSLCQQSQRSWAATPALGNWLSCDYNLALNGKLFPALQHHLVSHPLPPAACPPLPSPRSCQGRKQPRPSTGGCCVGGAKPCRQCWGEEQRHCQTSCEHPRHPDHSTQVFPLPFVSFRTLPTSASPCLTPPRPICEYPREARASSGHMGDLGCARRSGVRAHGSPSP